MSLFIHQSVLLIEALMRSQVGTLYPRGKGVGMAGSNLMGLTTDV